MAPAPKQRTGRGAGSPAGGSAGADLRRMVLLLETAAVLEARAQRAADPTQVAVLLRRADQRRQEALRLRADLAARGAALPVRPMTRSRVADTVARSPRRTENGMAESSG